MDCLRRLSRALRVFASTLALSFPLLQQSALAAPTVENYAAFATVQMMAISPDGKMVAFRRKTSDQDLLVAYSLERNAVTRAVDISSIRPHHLYFLDHSRVVMVASDELWLRRYGGQNRISTGFLLDVNSGQLTQLLKPGDNIATGQTGLGRLLGISPDGQRLFMPAYVEHSMREPATYSLMEVNLESVKRPKVAAKGSRDTIDFFLDREGQLVAEEIYNNLNNRHSIIAYHEGKAREIFAETALVPEVGVAALMPDGKHLLVSKESENSDRLTYYKMSLVDGTISDPVFDRSDADVESVLTDINRVAFGVRFSGLTPTYEFFDAALGERMRKIQAQYDGHSVWLRDWSPDLRHLVVTLSGLSSSGDYWLFSEDGSSRFLAAARPDIPAAHVNPVITYQYEARDGWAIPALLTIPLAHVSNPANLPAVILPHGGPASHDWLGFDWMAQALASRGYVVLQPQFRGSSGFGLQHLWAGRGEWGRKMQDDVSDGLQRLVADKIVDPKRVCIMGASYGGYSALAGGAFTPDLYRCVVSINGVADVKKMLDTEKADHGRYHWVLSYWEDVIANGKLTKDDLKAISPANFAANFKAPVLLIHGTKDTVVRYDQSKNMHKQLQRAKKTVELVKLKGEDHSLSEPETRLQALKAATDFIDRHIGTPL